MATDCAAMSPSPSVTVTTALIVLPRFTDSSYEPPGVGWLSVSYCATLSTPVDPFLNPFGFQQKQTERALGSGFVWDKNGHIVTNYHVVAGARTALVSFSNNESVRARVIGTDPSTDVAVLRANLKSRALTPLIYSHVNPYGMFRLNMSERMHIEDETVPA